MIMDMRALSHKTGRFWIFEDIDDVGTGTRRQLPEILEYVCVCVHIYIYACVCVIYIYICIYYLYIYI